MNQCVWMKMSGVEMSSECDAASTVTSSACSSIIQLLTKCSRVNNIYMEAEQWLINVRVTLTQLID